MKAVPQKRVLVAANCALIHQVHVLERDVQLPIGTGVDHRMQKPWTVQTWLINISSLAAASSASSTWPTSWRVMSTCQQCVQSTTAGDRCVRSTIETSYPVLLTQGKWMVEANPGAARSLTG